MDDDEIKMLAEQLERDRLPFSEDDLADKFSTEHVDRLRFCHDWGRWLEWTGTRWHDRATLHKPKDRSKMERSIFRIDIPAREQKLYVRADSDPARDSGEDAR